MNTKQRLIQRLKWYYPLERLHAFVTFPFFIVLAWYLYPLKETIFITYGLVVCTYILFQGQKYWKIKLSRLRNQSIDQEKNLRFFEQSKKINVFLLGLIPIFFVIQLWLMNWEITMNRLFLFSVFVNIFAVLEHINYYHIQLMIDNKYDFLYVLRNKKLKRASLANDLDRKQF